MKTLSILPVLIAITFGLKEVSETAIIPATVKSKTEAVAFAPVNVTLNYYSGPGSAYELEVYYSCTVPGSGCVYGWITYQFQGHAVSNPSSGVVSFPGVAIQPNVTQTLHLGSYDVKFYWPGTGTACIVTSIS